MIKKRLAAIIFTILLFALPVPAFASTLNEVKEYVEDYYIGDLSGDLDKATSINAVIDLLDPYSSYFTADEFTAFLNSVDLTSVGIGIVIEKVENGILITDLIEGGSAALAGIVTGDIITAVDAKTTATMTLEEAVSLITGKEHTSVTLKVLREDGSIFTKTVARKAFSLPNVTTSLLYGNVGYISLASFSTDTASLISKAVTSLKKQGATSFILDIQNNGGGYVTAAEELIGMFPNAKNAYQLKETSGTYLTPALPQSVKFPVNTKLLVNRYSASSSEMTAAALLDQKAAVLYGEQTYGKGSMQTFFELTNGSYLKLTVGHFMGPANTLINEVGITPNIVTTSDPLYKAHYDTIISQFTNYNEKTNLVNVPTSKTFTVNFNASLAETIASGAVELVELGGNTVDVSVTMGAKPNQLLVNPVKPLTAGKEYALLIHPTINDTTGKALKRGYYLHITVAPN